MEGPNACTSLSVVSLGCLLGPEACWAISLTTSDSSSLLRGKRQLSIRSPKSPPAVNRAAIPIVDRKSRGVIYQTPPPVAQDDRYTPIYDQIEQSRQ